MSKTTPEVQSLSLGRKYEVTCCGVCISKLEIRRTVHLNSERGGLWMWGYWCLFDASSTQVVFTLPLLATIQPLDYYLYCGRARADRSPHASLHPQPKDVGTGVRSTSGGSDPAKVVAFMLPAIPEDP